MNQSTTTILPDRNNNINNNNCDISKRLQQQNFINGAGFENIGGTIVVADNYNNKLTTNTSNTTTTSNNNNIQSLNNNNKIKNSCNNNSLNNININSSTTPININNNNNNSTTTNNNIVYTNNNSPQYYQTYSSSPTHLFMNPEVLVPQINSNSSSKSQSNNMISGPTSSSSFDSNVNSPNSYSAMNDIFIDSGNCQSQDPMDIFQSNNYQYQIQSSPIQQLQQSPQQQSSHSSQHQQQQQQQNVIYNQQLFQYHYQTPYSDPNLMVDPNIKKENLQHLQQQQQFINQQQQMRMYPQQIHYNQSDQITIQQHQQQYHQQQQHIQSQIQQNRMNISPTKGYIKQESPIQSSTQVNSNSSVDNFNPPYGNNNHPNSFGLSPSSPMYSSTSTTPIPSVNSNNNNSNNKNNHRNTNTRDYEDYIKNHSIASFSNVINVPTELENIVPKDKEEIARHAYKTWVVIKPGNKIVKDKVWTLYYNKILSKYHLRDNHLGRKLNIWIEEDLKAYYISRGQDPDALNSTNDQNSTTKKRKPSSSKEGQHPAYLNIDLVSPSHSTDPSKPHPLSLYCENNNVFWTEPELSHLLETFKENRSRIMQNITPQLNSKKTVEKPLSPTINQNTLPTSPSTLSSSTNNTLNSTNSTTSNSILSHSTSSLPSPISPSLLTQNLNLKQEVSTTSTTTSNSTKKPIKKRKKISQSANEITLKNIHNNVSTPHITGFSPITTPHLLNHNTLNSNFNQTMISTMGMPLNMNNNHHHNNCNSLSSSTSSSPPPTIQCDVSLNVINGDWVNGEIYKAPDSYWIKIDLPGIPIEALRVSVIDHDNPKLLIAGERYPDQNNNFLLIFGKRNFGQFEIEAKLPIGVDTKRTSQYFGDGVLSIQCPFKIPPTI